MQSAHTQQWTYTQWTHTRSSGQRFFAAVAGEQLGVWCLAQGHPSRGIEGGESVVYMHSPNLQFLPVWDLNLQPFDYESDSLTIRPRLVPTCDYTSHKKVEQSFSVIIQKSVENYMGPTSLFVERSGSAVCVIWQITLQRNWMLNDYKRTTKKKNCAVLKVAKISIQFAYIYVHWTKW